MPPWYSPRGPRPVTRVFARLHAHNLDLLYHFPEAKVGQHKMVHLAMY